jgi:hypothetical protein
MAGDALLELNTAAAVEKLIAWSDASKATRRYGAATVLDSGR